MISQINKKFLFVIPLVGLSAFGFFLFQTKSHSPSQTSSLGKTQSSEQVRVISMRALRNQWTFDPKTVIVQKGDRVILKIFNEDEYPHGFALEAFGINKLLPPKIETIVEFVASEVGSFALWCSVPCGKGHFQMKGKVIVEEP